MDLHSSQTQQGEEKLKEVPSKLVYTLGLALFIYIGLETSVAGWISTLSILSGVSEK